MDKNILSHNNENIMNKLIPAVQMSAMTKKFLRKI